MSYVKLRTYLKYFCTCHQTRSATKFLSPSLCLHLASLEQCPVSPSPLCVENGGPPKMQHLPNRAPQTADLVGMNAARSPTMCACPCCPLSSFWGVSRDALCFRNPSDILGNPSPMYSYFELVKHCLAWSNAAFALGSVSPSRCILSSCQYFYHY